MRKAQSLQQMVLGKLDLQMQKIEIAWDEGRGLSTGLRDPGTGTFLQQNHIQA